MGEKSDEGGSAKAQQEENQKDDNYANFFFEKETKSNYASLSYKKNPRTKNGIIRNSNPIEESIVGRLIKAIPQCCCVTNHDILT